MTLGPRRLGRAAVALLGAVVLLFAGAGTAFAHNSLVGSSPLDGQSLASGPSSVTLTFSDVVQNIQPLVSVVGPDDGHYEGTAIDVHDNVVDAAVNPLGPAGAYTVSYRIVSADGHPVEGQFRFTLTSAGTGKPNAVVAGQATSDAIPAWVWVVAAAAVLAVVLVFGLRSVRRRES